MVKIQTWYVAELYRLTKPWFENDRLIQPKSVPTLTLRRLESYLSWR